MRTYTEEQLIAILDHIERNGFNDDCMTMNEELDYLNNICVVKNCSIPNVGQSLPDAEQCLKIQEQVKQYCYTDQDDKPVISSGGIRAIISRWKQMIG
jgi:hypothetical protein